MSKSNLPVTGGQNNLNPMQAAVSVFDARKAALKAQLKAAKKVLVLRRTLIRASKSEKKAIKAKLTVAKAKLVKAAK